MTANFNATAREKEILTLRDEIERLQGDKRRALKVADERSKENCALRQALKTAREYLDGIGDHPEPGDTIKMIDHALEQGSKQNGDEMTEHEKKALNVIEGGLNLLQLAITNDDPKRELEFRVREILADVRAVSDEKANMVAGFRYNSARS